MSNFEFKKLIIRNFMTIKSINFDYIIEEPLVWVDGEVVGSAATKSNGAGKSAIFLESLCWLFYDKTIRGLSKTKIVNRFVGKDCLIELQGKKDGKQFIAKRFRDHSEYGTGAELILVGEDKSNKRIKDSNSQLIDFLGITFEDFITSILFTNKSLKFSEMTDGQRKYSLEEMLDLQKWTKAKIELDKRSRKFKESILNIRKQVDNIKFILNTKNLELTVNLEKQKNEKKDNEKKVKELKEELDLLEGELNNKKKVVDLEVVKFSLVQKRDGELKNYQDELLVWNIKQLEVAKKLGVKEGERNNISLSIKELDTADVCPTCGQKVDVSQVIVKKQELEKRVEELVKEIWVLKSVEAKNNKEIKDCDEVIKDISEKYLKGLEVVDKEIEEVRKINNEKFLLLKDIQNLQNNNSSYELLIDSLKKEINKMNKEIEINNWLADNREKVLNRYIKFWEIGFSPRGVKSFIIQNMLPYMNIRASHYVALLTNSEFHINFSGQRKLTDGRLSEELDFRAVSKEGGDTYNAMSEGERRRVDIVIQLVLDDVRRLNSNFNINLRVYDELFDPLDSLGIDRILDTLKVMNKNSTVYLISHNKELTDKIDSKITVVKESNETKIRS